MWFWHDKRNVIQQEPRKRGQNWENWPDMIKTWDWWFFTMIFTWPTHKDIKRLGFSNKDIYGLVWGEFRKKVNFTLVSSVIVSSIRLIEKNLKVHVQVLLSIDVELGSSSIDAGFSVARLDKGQPAATDGFRMVWWTFPRIPISRLLGNHEFCKPSVGSASPSSDAVPRGVLAGAGGLQLWSWL